MRKILLTTTGGTIACADENESRTPVAALNGSLIEKLEKLPDNIEVEIVSPFCKDSTDMSPKEWTELAALIREKYKLFDGFVITHGTDTLGYAAAALSCLIRDSEKPVVLTGSMLPMAAKNSDAPNNLRNSIIYAADEKANGVVVAFNGKIIDGRRVSKTHSTAENAFESVNFPPIACFDERGITFTEPVSSFGGETRFFGEMDENVEVIFLVPGISPPNVGEKTRVVIVLGFGAGGLPKYGGWEEWLFALVSRGVYVVMSTQVLRGGSNLSLYETGSEIAKKYPVIDAGKMTVEYACMKAMWALAYSDSLDGFKLLFNQ